MTTEQQSFTELKEAVEEAVAAKDHASVAGLLAPEVGGGADRALDERLWAHRVYGWALYSTGDIEGGVAQLKTAYELEPRDQEVAAAYSRLLAEGGQGGPAVKVMRSLLVHHKNELSPSMLSAIYRYLGEHHFNQGEVDKAQGAFDQALVVDPADHHAAEGIMRTIGALEDPTQAVRAQRVLVRRLRDPSAKAAVLHHIGDDLWKKLDDRDGALRAYDEAMALTPTSAELTERKSELLLEMKRPDEAAEVLMKLLKASPDLPSQTRISYLDRVQLTLKQSPTGQQKRLSVLDAILDHDATRLDLFEELTAVCANLDAWEEMAASYRRMIKRLEGLDDPAAARAVPVLWRNLGEVLETHLDRADEAYSAFTVASKLLPSDVDLRKRILALVRDEDDKLLEALEIQRELVTLEPDSTGQLADYAKLLLRAGRYDEALCVLRVLRVEGNWSERWERHFARLQRSSLKMPSRSVTEEMRRNYLRPKEQSSILDAIMMVAEDVFGKLFANDMTAVGISEKDRLDMGQDLLFARLYDQIARLMGRRELPRVYVKRAMTGMANAIIDKPAFVIGPDLLSGKSDREVAFVIAQQLTLTRPEYVLTTIHQSVHLRSILLVLVNHIDPSIPVQSGPDVDQLRRMIEKYRKREARKHLEAAVGKLVAKQLDVNIDAWTEFVADEANRIGLLFCDDLGTADRAIADHPGVMGVHDVDQRRQRLHRWAVSDDYFRLRFELGLSVQEG